MVSPGGHASRRMIRRFDLQKTDAITLHLNSVMRKYQSQPGVSLFNDNNSYWSSITPTASVQVPHTGTKIRILAVTNLGLNMKIKVGPNA